MLTDVMERLAERIACRRDVKSKRIKRGVEHGARRSAINPRCAALPRASCNNNYTVFRIF